MIHHRARKESQAADDAELIDSVPVQLQTQPDD
jgi:hypothetical protein